MTVSTRFTIALATVPLILAVCGGVANILGVDPAPPTVRDAAGPATTSLASDRRLVVGSMANDNGTGVRDAFLRVPVVSADLATPRPARPALNDL
jgi:hypothetical protein